jgi:hypothetical protein
MQIVICLTTLAKSFEAQDRSDLPEETISSRPRRRVIVLLRKRAGKLTCCTAIHLNLTPFYLPDNPLVSTIPTATA